MPKQSTPKSNRKILVSIILYMLPLLAVGCVSPGNVQLMVPPANPQAKPVVSNSVWISDVKGGGNENDRGDNKATWRFVATNEEFKQALLLTLTRSNLFQSIGNENSDLELRVEIKRQEISRYQKVSMFEWRAFIGVAYEIIDRKSGRMVWKEAYWSEAGHVQTGAVHAVKAARENSVRESLECFVNRISYQWPQLSYSTQPKNDFQMPKIAQGAADSPPASLISETNEAKESVGNKELNQTSSATEALIDNLSSKPSNQSSEPLSKLDISNKATNAQKNSMAILPINASKNFHGVAEQYYITTKGAVIDKFKKLSSNNQEFRYIYNYYALGGDSSYTKSSPVILSEDTLNLLWVGKSTFSDNRELNADFAIEIGKKLNADLVFTCDLFGQAIKVILIDVATKKVNQKTYSYSTLGGYTAAPNSLDDFLDKYRTGLLK